ncbi:hypothetical protein BPAE_0281g00120 [Botrytis paeoniae]|uniref:Uncharacterized protein n=1 Tax=Botrytis paeoniae TaxID=278948 RepID=A0A4Z1FCW3_9HELO|nr:hypothetical protein BPAE_0281g00120 [Botrytis paeoniae]
MEDHSYSLPIWAKDTQSVVQKALSKENIELRPAADVHSDQKTFDVTGCLKPYSPHAPIELAAVSNDDAPQSQLPLRHDNQKQPDSNGGTRINLDKSDVSATRSIDSKSSPKKKPNGRVLYCNIPCGGNVNIPDEKKFNINPYTNFYFVYYNIKVPFVTNEALILLATNKIDTFCDPFIIEF